MKGRRVRDRPRCGGIKLLRGHGLQICNELPSQRNVQEQEQAGYGWAMVSIGYFSFHFSLAFLNALGTRLTSRPGALRRVSAVPANSINIGWITSLDSCQVRRGIGQRPRLVVRGISKPGYIGWHHVMHGEEAACSFSPPHLHL